MYLEVALILVLTVLIIMLVKPKENFAIQTELLAITPKRSEMIIDLQDHKTVATIFKENNATKTIFLLHGYPYQQTQWDPLIDVFDQDDSKNANIVTYDLRGCGSAYNVNIPTSTLDNNPDNYAWSLDTFFKDFETVYDTIKPILGYDKITIAGWGFGGLLAQYIALYKPNIITKLYLLQPSIPQDKYIPMVNSLSDWIKQYSNIQNLPIPNDLLNNYLCRGFYIQDKNICPASLDQTDETNTTEFYDIQEILHSSNARAALQILKLNVVTNVGDLWNQLDKAPYDIYILSAKDDPVTRPNDIVRLYNILKTKTLRMPILDIVTGKHYFTFLHPDYIAKILAR